MVQLVEILGAEVRLGVAEVDLGGEATKASAGPSAVGTRTILVVMAELPFGESSLPGACRNEETGGFRGPVVRGLVERGPDERAPGAAAPSRSPPGQP
ncbi:hypothetical protein A3L22_07070 [Streptomyces griseus subsp. griseus]|nr:hypothetical protein A3L22_07070 [Streptomyces griseus subsp. griseus]